MTSAAENEGARLKPGTRAPRSGVYRVRHYAHRLTHTVFILEGTVLPECRQCGHYVSFVPMIPAGPIDRDIDFRDAGEAQAAS